MIRTYLASLAAVCGLAQAAPPAQQFFEAPHYKDALLSPSGRYVAVRVGTTNLRDRLLVFEIDTLAVVGGARLADYDIGQAQWVNDKRLVFNIVDYKAAPGDIRYAPGLYAINSDGKDLRQLADHGWEGRNSGGTMIKVRSEPWNTFLLEQAGAQDSNTIYVRRPVWEQDGLALLRTDLVKLDTVSGQSSYVQHPASAQQWLLDQEGQPRVMVSERAGKASLHLRSAQGEWRTLATFGAYSGDSDHLEPVGFYDAQRLLVKVRQQGDKAALHLLDLASGALDPQPLVALADFDFIGEPIYARRRLAGIRFIADAQSTVWFDPALKAAQQAVDKLLPGTVNLVTPPLLAETPWLLVASYSDRQPVVYLLYNSQSGALKGIGGSHPDIQPAEMGQQQFVHYRARDGMEIPAWLTLPAGGGKNLPLVVLVHGGPYVRGTQWGWEQNAQFLASRGYAVLEPEFRGSLGYGDQLFRAGLQQWGLAMQDDVADAVQWAVQQGHADPRRVCLMGGSYGGYATLMGLIKDPALYRCGVAYAAVVDIPLLLDRSMGVLSDMGEEYRKYGAPLLLGDVHKDAARFTATSPLQQAARLQRPLLLAHGSDDVRVPVQHFRKLRAALKEAHAPAEFIEYEGEAHGWSLLATRLDFWGRVEKFLDKHIGAGAKTE